MYLLKILSFAGLCILLINNIIYSIGFSQRDKAYRFFVVYLFSLFMIQMTTEIFAIRNINNHFIATYYLFIPFVLLSLFFFRLFKELGSWKKYMVMFSSPLLVAGLAAQYLIKPNLYYEFNSVGLLVSTCVLVVYAVMYLFELISRQMAFHYVIIGIFIYYISSLLIFASATTIMSFTVEMGTFIWNINAFLFIVYQLLILWEWKQNFYLKPIKRG